MRLTDDRVAVEVLEPETTTSMGIVIRSADERPTEGVVKAIGPGKRNKDGVVIPLTLKVGDKVMFPAGSGLKVTVAGETLSIFKEEEIIAVLGD